MIVAERFIRSLVDEYEKIQYNRSRHMVSRSKVLRLKHYLHSSDEKKVL